MVLSGLCSAKEARLHDLPLVFLAGLGGPPSWPWGLVPVPSCNCLLLERLLLKQYGKMIAMIVPLAAVGCLLLWPYGLVPFPLGLSFLWLAPLGFSFLVYPLETLLRRCCSNRWAASIYNISTVISSTR